MTTFTTEDRILAEKDGSFTANVSPPHIVDSGASVDHKDLEFPGFNMRFVKQGDDWVCTMPNWLMDLAVVMANGLPNVPK